MTSLHSQDVNVPRHFSRCAPVLRSFAGPRRHREVAAGLAGFLVTLLSTPAQAQQTGGSFSGGFVHAVANDQARELGSGFWGQASMDIWANRWLAVGPSLRGLGVPAANAPRDRSLAPRGAAYLVGLGITGQLRPLASRYNGTAFNASGFWVSAGAGMAQTGGRTRAYVDVGVGFDLWAAPALGLGPMVGLLYVPQPDDSVRRDNAALGLLGLHVTFDPAILPRRPAEMWGRDRDRDGIPDEQDVCPDEAEDKDGYRDADGCPDPDNDGDGIPDVRDRCPNEAEDFDGFQDKDGCPESDNDGDRIPDARDICPNEAEDFDGFQDEDGCPEEDNDQDGILDAQDKCPNEPETKNGYADDDGCPDEPDVRVTGDEILLEERIYFQINRAFILPRSFAIIGKLAGFLKKHPEYIRVSIEGHTDETGTVSYNQPLSEARAKAVRTKLIAFGVAAARLTVVGYGAEKPQIVGDDEKAYRKNRRVEFLVTRRVVDVAALEGSKKP